MRHKDLSLSTKILLILIIFIFPLNLLALITSIITISDARESVSLATHTTLANYTEEIDAIIENTESELSSVFSSPYIFDSYFSGTNTSSIDYQTNKEMLIQEILRHQNYYSTADYFFFCQTELDDYLLIPHNNKKLDNFMINSQDYYNNTENTKPRWTLININSESYLVHFYLYRSVCYGALIHLDPIVDDISQHLKFSPEEIRFQQEDAVSDSFQWISEGCRNADLVLSVTFNRFLLNHSISAFRWVLIVLIALFILLIPFIYHLLDIWLIRPLHTLEKAHQKLQEGEETYRIAEASNSVEFRSVFRSFNKMADSLQTLRIENTNKELAKNKMLLDNLQLQIRPHFLLNAFDLLFALVQQPNIKAAQKLILYLSDYFRYLFRYNRNLELFSKEYELIQRYLEIAQIQTHNSFIFQADFEPEINFVRIPPLLLHNFIENVISHALIPGKITHIMMDGTYENGYVTFHIADDGRGMPQEDADLINQADYQDYANGRHVGIRNSITRLKYFYDQKGSITVTSKLGEGSIFTITFPYDLDDSEENRDETTDSK